MSQNKSAKKRIVTSKKENLRNRRYTSILKTSIKKVTSSKKKEEAEEHLKATVSILDKLAAKKIIHKNKAANKKSQLVKLFNSLT